jgi:ariadne-1
MDSEDDMHDANDIESLDDDFYSGETEDVPMDYGSDYDDDDDADDYFDDGDDSDPAESRRTEVFLLPFFFCYVNFPFNFLFSW